MKTNLGKLDKSFRFGLGVAIIIFGAHLNTVWGVLGMIPIISAQAGVCPLYFVLGISTGKKAKKA
jgi:hypothetical protein